MRKYFLRGKEMAGPIVQDNMLIGGTRNDAPMTSGLPQ
jgi:hypothetical protein